MSQAIQTSFHAGEWAPALNARVDLAKYHSAAALLRNFFVDYRGGASTRPGTKWILQAYKSATAVRLISFQASFTVGYVLEFGDFYVRFYNNGSPVLNSPENITGATRSNPAILTYINPVVQPGDWVYVQGVGGMTELNNRYFIVGALGVNFYTLLDLFGNPVNSTGYGVYTGGGTASRVYTLPTPYAAADLALLKFTPNVSTLTLCHPSYTPQLLTLITATNWTLVPISFGPTISAPTGVGSVTSNGGSGHYTYVITAVDSKGQESTTSALTDIGSATTGIFTNTVSWTAVTGALSYNVYRAGPSVAGAVPAGPAYGFVANVTGVSFADTFTDMVASNPSDFAESIPISKNPFQGAGVASVTITAAGTYTTVPGVTFAAAPAGGATATGSAVLGVTGTPTIGTTQNGFAAGDIVVFRNNVIVTVATVDGAGNILTFQPITYTGSSHGSVVSGATPTNPNGGALSTNGGGQVNGLTANFVWGVVGVAITSQGAGYVAAPAVTFSSGAAAGTSVLATASSGNPSVPCYFDQRLVLAAQTNAPQSINASQPGAFYNFNISNPIQEDDAISQELVSGQLNTIKALIPMQAGLIVLGDKTSWLINGGSAGQGISPINITANPQSYVGANDVPPIVANFDILFVQAKGSVVRDNAFDFYKNVFTGTDISVLSSHLFYGYTVTGWAWAEEPYKIVWATRDDGTLLSLTFLKEQELIGWAHSDTDGLFKSVAVVTETVDSGSVDAVYLVVERTISGHTVKYIERMAERIFPNGAEDAWCVDSGLQYDGAPATTFTGGEHLAGATVTGLADGIVIPSFVMAANGGFTLTAAASKVTVGLAYTPQLQTLAIDLGEPTVQGQQKKISQVIARVENTLGLKTGSDFDHMVAMKDLVVGNVGSETNTVVTDLVTGDAMTLLDPKYTEQGQYCFEQPYPFPATILGVIPTITTASRK